MGKAKDNDLIRIGYFMKLNNITREDMALKLDVTSATVTNIVHNKTYPSVHVLIKCSEIFDIDIKELFNSTKKSNGDDVNEAKQLIKKGLELLEKHI